MNCTFFDHDQSFSITVMALYKSVVRSCIPSSYFSFQLISIKFGSYFSKVIVAFILPELQLFIDLLDADLVKAQFPSAFLMVFMRPGVSCSHHWK